MKLRVWGLICLSTLLVIGSSLFADTNNKDKRSQARLSGPSPIVPHKTAQSTVKSKPTAPVIKTTPPAAVSHYPGSGNFRSDSNKSGVIQADRNNPWKPSNKPLVTQYDKSRAANQSVPAQHFRNYQAPIRTPNAVESNVPNGGFEADPSTLLNWSVNDQAGGSGSWFVQTGGGSPVNGFPVASPSEGIQAAMTDTTGPGSHILYQDIIVPPSATLSFDLYVQNQAGIWYVPVPDSLDYNVFPNQHVRVDIMDPNAPVDDVGAGVLRNLFLTDPSDPTTFGYIRVTTDLYEFAGLTVRLRFAEVDNQFYQNMGVDNVNLVSNAMGLVGDFATNSVVAFDPRTHVVLGSVSIPASCGGAAIVGDVVITPDGTQAFVSDFCNEVFVIDLTVTPPVLATGINPIPVSQFAEDLTITADGKYLLVSNPTVSVVDIASRTEIGVYGGTSVQGFEVCSDNSILTADYFNQRLRRLAIDGTGAISDPGESLTVNGPINISCVPGSSTGLGGDFAQAVSFNVPGLALADQEPMSSYAQTVITNRAGNKVYVRNSCNGGTVEYLDYDFTTGALSSSGISLPLSASTDCWFGLDQIALYRDKLFVSDAGAVNVYSASSGSLLDSITDAAISNPTGIAIWTRPEVGVGLIADNATNSAVVFDPVNDAVNGVVPIPVNGGVIGDTAISKDGTLGFVANFGNQVYVIDLTATPPVLASGTNPIGISNNGEDLAISPDGNFLLATGGGGSSAISVVDIAARTEIGAFPMTSNGVDVCSDNSVLIVADGFNLHRLTIDGSGNLTDTGEFLGAGTNNVSCVSGALTGVTGDYSSSVTSFSVPGLSTLDTDNVAASAQAFTLNADRLFIFDCGANQVSAFDYNSSSGAMASVFSFGATSQPCWYGIDTLTAHPDGSKLYVAEWGSPGVVNIYNPSNGSHLNSIADPAIVNPTGISLHINSRFAAVKDHYSTPKNVQLNVSAPGVLSNELNENGDPLTAVLDTDAPNGTVVLNADGSFTYTPDSGFAGADTFTYHANNGSADSNVAVVTIDVINNLPVAFDDNYFTTRNVQVSVNAPGVLGNDTDANGDSLTSVLNSNPSNGGLTFDTDGGFVYTPNSGFAGTDSFTYYADDGNGGSNIAIVNITVTNTTPVANDDSYSTNKNVTLNVPAPGVLGNDTDADGDALAAGFVSGPSNGTLGLNSDGSFSYTPNNGFEGSDSFTYQAFDGLDVSNTATVNITVVNTPPVANDDSYVTDKNVQLVVPAPGVLGNDTDADGESLIAFLNVPPTNGTLTLNSDGSFTYTPNTDFVGTDTFTYHAKDSTLDSNIATVTLTVNQTCLYCDDFNDDVLDPNWTYVKQQWTESGGTLNGTPTGRKAVAVATPVFAGCQNCSVEASMQTSGGPFNKVWMLGWYVDKKNTMELLMKEENERWVLKQRSNGSVVAKGKGIKTIDPNTAYIVRIVYTGTVFQVFVDDLQTPLFTLNPAAAVPVGTVGFETKNTTGKFDYITVN